MLRMKRVIHLFGNLRTLYMEKIGATALCKAVENEGSYWNVQPTSFTYIIEVSIRSSYSTRRQMMGNDIVVGSFRAMEEMLKIIIPQFVPENITEKMIAK